MIWKYIVDFFVSILIFLLSWLPDADYSLQVDVSSPLETVLQWGSLLTFLTHWQVLVLLVVTAVTFEMARLLLWIWLRVKGAILAS